MTSIQAPAVININEAAFSGCEKLKEINFPNAKSIGISAFECCTSLTNASFPKVDEIQAYAFNDCTNLAIVSLPSINSIENIAECSFDGCKSLSEIHMDNASVCEHFYDKYCSHTKGIKVSYMLLNGEKYERTVKGKFS